MLFKNFPIERKIRRVIMLTSGAILLLTFASYFIYEFITFRQTATRNLSVQAKIIASNSTAALAFQSPEEGDIILSALRADSHIVVAALYDQEGTLFSWYPKNYPQNLIPQKVLYQQYRFEKNRLIYFEPVKEDDKMLGLLYIESDMNALYDRLRLYATMALLIITASVLLAFFLSRALQGTITKPVLALAQLARAVSERRDYTVRATKVGNDELGLLTDAFNAMLSEIQEQNEKILAFNEKLESTVTERTKDLEEANKELEAFSYSVSHDLRAPVRSINGFARILLEDHTTALTETGLKTVNTIIRNGERMGQLIDDLLAFSQLGRLSVTKVLLDMNAIVNAVIVEIQSQNTVIFNVDLAPLPPAEGDSSMIKQVMQNLIGNAVKYSRKKEQPSISIGSYREGTVNVYFVKDNGAGFNMKYYDKLFGVFQRLHSSSEFEGTGVGLALVHRIVTKHGGRVWAEGVENDGATFYFSLPIN